MQPNAKPLINFEVKRVNGESCISSSNFLRATAQRFGLKVATDRQLPDIHDGLLPVQRRILFEMWRMKLGHKAKPVKSAQIVGNTVGNFHPHSPEAVYEALVRLTKTPVALADGTISSFGSKGSSEKASSMRYTETRLTKIAEDTVVNSKYMALANYVENYSETIKEPLFLPVLIPLIMLNEQSGIGYGISTLMPPFALEGLMKLFAIYLKKGRVTIDDLEKHLAFNYFSHPICTASPKTLRAFYKEGKGAITFAPRLKQYEGKREVHLVGLPPGVKLEDLAALLEGIKFTNVQDLSADDEVKIILTLPPSANFKESVAEIKAALKVTMHYKCTVTLRDIDNKTSIIPVSPLGLFHMWAEWRVNLEERYLHSEVAALKASLRKVEIKASAASNRAALVKALASSNPIASIGKLLSLTKEETEWLLSCSIKTLTKLEEDALQTEAKALRREIKIIERDKLGNLAGHLLEWVNSLDLD